MELDNLINYSNFIKSHKSLISNFNNSDYSKKSIINYFNNNLQDYFNAKSENYEKFQKLKDQIIILIFISRYRNIIDQITSARLWSLLMRKYLGKIFHHYLSSTTHKIQKEFYCSYS